MNLYVKHHIVMPNDKARDHFHIVTHNVTNGHNNNITISTKTTHTVKKEFKRNVKQFMNF